MFTLISSTILRFKGKISEGTYEVSMILGLCEIILTCMMLAAIIDQIKTGI